MTSDTNRGKVFGQMQSAFMIGMFCTTMVAGVVAAVDTGRRDFSFNKRLTQIGHQGMGVSMAMGVPP